MAPADGFGLPADEEGAHTRPRGHLGISKISFTTQIFFYPSFRACVSTTNRDSFLSITVLRPHQKRAFSHILFLVLYVLIISLDFYTRLLVTSATTCRLLPSILPPYLSKGRDIILKCWSLPLWTTTKYGTL